MLHDYFYLLTNTRAHQTHYEQNGDLVGEIEVDGKVFRFETPSMRDHSYGSLKNKCKIVSNLFNVCQQWI